MRHCLSSQLCAVPLARTPVPVWDCRPAPVCMALLGHDVRPVSLEPPQRNIGLCIIFNFLFIFIKSLFHSQYNHFTEKPGLLCLSKCADFVSSCCISFTNSSSHGSKSLAIIDVDVSGPQWCVIVTVITGAIAYRQTSARANRAGLDPPVRQVCLCV